MTNPLVHAIVLAAAVLIPGGLLVYFAWAAYTRKQRKFQAPGDMPTPDEAREAFRQMYPPDSLRGQSRLRQLNRASATRRRNPPK
jgi:hypothetical protein